MFSLLFKELSFIFYSEEMLFENVNGRTTDDERTDGRRMPVYTISSNEGVLFSRQNGGAMQIHTVCTGKYAKSILEFPLSKWRTGLFLDFVMDKKSKM